MDADQKQFLRDELFSLTLMATVQRAGVYRSNTSEQKRRGFQATLRSTLEQLAEKYEKEVGDEAHIRNLVALSDSLTEEHASVLKGGHFRLGTAQKALNLYLKYLWCLGQIRRPPHCPFDYRIISKLSSYDGPKWTELEQEIDYRKMVTAAKLKAQGVPLAIWELRAYNNAKKHSAADTSQATNR